MTKLFAIFFLGFISTLNAFAEVKSSPIHEERISELLSQSKDYKVDGPNCFATTLYTAGFIDDFATIGETLRVTLKGPYCQSITFSEAKAGDIAAIEGFDVRYFGWSSHAAIFVSPTKVFAKMGYNTHAVTEITSAKENLKMYLEYSTKDKSCIDNAFNPAFDNDCGDSAFPNIYRCELEKFRSDIEKSSMAPSWKSLLDVRKKMAALTLTKNISAADLANIKAELEVIQNQTRTIADNEFTEVIIALQDDSREQLRLLTE